MSKTRRSPLPALCGALCFAALGSTTACSSTEGPGDGTSAGSAGMTAVAGASATAGTGGSGPLAGAGGSSAGASSAGAAGLSGSAGAGGSAGLAAPVFSEADMALMRILAPAQLPAAPPDISNDWADDAAAVAFGRTLFNETAFSGELLDVDNDGGPNALGERGEIGRVACSGCHIERAGFTDTRSIFQEISLAAGWTKRRTPSLLDVAQVKLLTWGGRHSTLHGQIFGVIESPLEMNSSRLFFAQQIRTLYADEYQAIFGEGSLEPLADTTRFPTITAENAGCKLTRPMDHPRALPPNDIYACHGMPGDAAEYDGMSAADQDIVTRIVVNAGKAIGAFQRTLKCGPGRFDDFVHGNATALNDAEQRGLQLFLGKGKCVSCHSGPFLSDQSFHNVGLAEGPTREDIDNSNDRGAALDLTLAASDPLSVSGRYSDGDDGRLPTEISENLEGAFRTPMLRCVNQRPTFMHSGLLLSLDEVVAFFDRGGDEPGSYLGTGKLEPLGLTTEERRDLVRFLEALDGVPR